MVSQICTLRRSRGCKACTTFTTGKRASSYHLATTPERPEGIARDGLVRRGTAAAEYGAPELFPVARLIGRRALHHTVKGRLGSGLGNGVVQKWNGAYDLCGSMRD